MEYPDYRTEYIQGPTPIGTRKLAKKWGVAYTRIVKQCQKERWVEQRSEFQGKVKAKQEADAIETLAEARARWAKTYRAMQAAGLKGLSKHAPRTASEAARMLDIGLKGEIATREHEEADQTPNTWVELLEAALGDERP